MGARHGRERLCTGWRLPKRAQVRVGGQSTPGAPLEYPKSTRESWRRAGLAWCSLGLNGRPVGSTTRTPFAAITCRRYGHAWLAATQTNSQASKQASKQTNKQTNALSKVLRMRTTPSCNVLRSDGSATRPVRHTTWRQSSTRQRYLRPYHAASRCVGQAGWPPLAVAAAGFGFRGLTGLFELYLRHLHGQPCQGSSLTGRPQA